MRRGAEAGSDIGPGLGFVRADTFVDQHFLKRGRIGRMLAVMAQQNIRNGVGVEEDSAAVFVGATVESIGAKGVLVADLSTATTRSVKPVALKGVTLSWLAPGDRIDLATGRVEVSRQKRAGKRLDGAAPDFKPYYNAVRFYPDFLSEGTLLDAMSELVDSRATETRGIAFEVNTATSAGATAQAASDTGFEFRLYKTRDTIAYLAATRGDDDYSIERLGLDVVPVAMAKPLYRPMPVPATGAARDGVTNEQSAAAAGAKAGENGGLGKKNMPTPENQK
jgi:cyanophycinase